MEWVEITGKTIDEAKELALDQLGVDLDEAEFEILDEPKAGLFGRVRGEARVRARVRPTAPRSKDGGRRGRAKRNDDEAEAAKEQVSAGNGARSSGASDPVVISAIAEVAAAGDEPRSDQRNKSERESRGDSGRSRGGGRGRGGRGRGGESRPRRSDGESSRGERGPVSVEALEEQGKVAVTFLNGLLDAFAIEASVAIRSVNDSAVEVAVDGQDLGLLVGPRGATLQAIQELTRTAVLRETGMRDGWVIVDVAEYRVKRRAALEKFALQVAEQVTSGGTAVRLDPMPPADRKVVHDVLTPLEGIETSSEGEEPRR
ncbi:MAG: Jag N-terminal domain-containing protein, partial [Actinobacteria bacterium]|nr:Jag N-terminal domain-containing protein [Actinomycetota bacterium]